MRSLPLSARSGISVWLRAGEHVCSFKPSLREVLRFGRESWLRYGFGRTRRKPRLVAYNEGSVWLEAERVVQETHARDFSWGPRSLPWSNTESVSCLFCFLFVSFLSLCWPETASSKPVIAIFDMSQAHSGWIGEPDDEMLHRFWISDVLPDQWSAYFVKGKSADRWPSVGRPPSWVTIRSESGSVGELAHLNGPDGL